ncbi:Yip1 family protein [Leeia oryzae]|uniref:Yip1 family protein n=1 Tax=Leeia oryzae TaxID=356662 RepID=UPI00039E6E8D|nr:Yip1 family protein [Leeia oryzae]
MNPLQYTKMPFSFHAGWDRIVNIHPKVLRTFLLLVLPFSLIPPATLLYAGNHHLSVWLQNDTHSDWLAVAIIFFIAELLTVPMMGWVIKHNAGKYNLNVSFKDTYLLAAIIAVPMWLSSLGLLASSMWMTIGLAIAGLALAASLLYHGLYAELKMEDRFEAQSLSYEIFSLGGAVWVMLCVFLVVPLIK